ncbi:MAG: response regulator [Nitrospinae bacterium]|nr:response regulator [Nitrospinota bacterium]
MNEEKRVLVVDDSKIIRQILRSHLAEWGITRVSEAEDGYEALSELEETRFDLVLLDWGMPKMNGMQALRLIRTREGMNRETPVIMVTAEAHKENIIVALKEGVNDYVVKPFNPEILRAKVEQALAKAKPRIEID